MTWFKIALWEFWMTRMKFLSTVAPRGAFWKKKWLNYTSIIYNFTRTTLGAFIRVRKYVALFEQLPIRITPNIISRIVYIMFSHIATILISTEPAVSRTPSKPQNTDPLPYAKLAPFRPQLTNFSDFVVFGCPYRKIFASAYCEEILQLWDQLYYN